MSSEHCDFFVWILSVFKFSVLTEKKRIFDHVSFKSWKSLSKCHLEYKKSSGAKRLLRSIFASEYASERSSILNYRNTPIFCRKNDIFLICTKHRLWIPVRTVRGGGSNEYPQSMFWSKNKKNRYMYNPASFTI